MVKKSISEKEKELLDKIEKAKRDLTALQRKQKVTIGSLAYKYNLNQLEESKLDEEFKSVALKHGLVDA